MQKDGLSALSGLIHARWVEEGCIYIIKEERGNQVKSDVARGGAGVEEIGRWKRY